MEYKSDEITENLLIIPPDGIDLKHILMEIEHCAIREVLKRTHGNKTKAAQLLSLNRTTMFMKIKNMEKRNGYSGLL